jgi:hypothetical protein
VWDDLDGAAGAAAEQMQPELGRAAGQHPRDMVNDRFAHPPPFQARYRFQLLLAWKISASVIEVFQRLILFEVIPWPHSVKSAKSSIPRPRAATQNTAFYGQRPSARSAYEQNASLWGVL